MSVLAQIFAKRREDVLHAKSVVPIADLKARISEQAAPRGFTAALENRNKPIGLIAEIKPASPSKGLIKPDLDAGLVAQHYAWAGAHAVSVLTEPHHFLGSFDNLIAAHTACPLPILRKDFLDDPYQIYESRSIGADAVLLIVAALEPPKLKHLQDLAQELGMDALVEVHTEAEAETALKAGAKVIGVNSRNLATLETNLDVVARILPIIRGAALCVAESALSSSADVERMRKAGADAVLIGTVFCEADDVEAKVREVMDW